MNKQQEFFEIFNIVVNTSNEQSVIVNSLIGASLQDHPKFESYHQNFKTFIKPRYHEGYPYTVGYIDNAAILIDPNMKYTDLRLFKNNDDLIYNFEKFQTDELI
jgi:hypothetical protein